MKVVLWFLTIVLGIILLIVIALQIPGVQNFAAQKGASYLSGMLGTKVTIGRFTTDWRNSFVLKEVYLEDQQQDTLWYAERLGVDMRFFSLLSGELNISKVDLDNATVKLHIREDSTTNFDFIMEAFASDTTDTQPTDTTAAMAINLGVVNLNNVYLVFRDDLGGNYIKSRVGELTTTMEEFDLDAQRYLVDEVELRNTWVNYEQTKIPPPSEDPEPLEIDFGLNRVALENINFKFINQVAEQRVELKLGESEVISDNINLKGARIDLKSLTLHNTQVLYVQEKYKPSDSLAVNPKRTAEKLDKSVEEANVQPMNWVLALDKLEVSGLNVQFDNFNMPRQQKGMDYDHLYFTNVVMDAEDVSYSLNRTEAKVNQLQLKEKSGFTLQNLQASIIFDSTSTSITGLDLKTPNSRLQNQLAMQYPSLDAMAEKPSSIVLDIDVRNSYIGMKDITYFVPDLAQDPSFRSIANSTIQVEAQATGLIDNLQIRNLQLIGLSGTNIDVNGSIRNTLDPDNLYLDANIRQFVTTRTDVQALLPAGTLPPNIKLPEQMSITGNFTGGLTAFDARADIRTSFGNADVDVDMGANETFTATVYSGGFDLGQMFTDSLGLGKIALTAKATGQGFSPETMQANVQGNIQLLDYNNYTYNNIALNANINRNLYAVKATTKDQNLAFNLIGDFNLRNENQPVYNFTLDLGKANLQALNMYPDPLTLQGQLSGQFRGADASTLSGKLTGNQLLVQHLNRTYPIDTLMMTLSQSKEMAAVTIQSDLLDAEMNFENSLATLPTALQKHFSNYFDLQPDPPYPANLNLGDFKATLNLKKTGLIASFVPGLLQLRTSEPITASYNGGTQQFQVDGTVNKLVYTDYTLNNLKIQMRGDRNQLGYNLALNSMLSPSFNLRNATLEGAARDDELLVKLAVAEDSATAKFVLGGALTSIGRGYRFAFNPEQLVINGDTWAVPQDNYLQFDTNLLYAKNLRLERNNMALALNSTGSVSPNAPLKVTFENLDIGYLVQAFQKEDSLVNGVINGEATLQHILTDNLSFTSDLKITDLIYQRVPVGNIVLQANSEGGNRYNVTAGLTGNNNQLKITGFMETQPNATLLNLNANISSLNIASLQGFTAGTVDDLDGRASGNLRIAGSLDNPSILGQLNFDQAQFNISMLGSVFTLKDEQLVFNESGINLSNFTLTDSLGNDLLVNGDILTKNYLDYQFDLKVNTDRFLAINSTAKDNDLYYGTVYMAATATVTGNLSEPVVNARVNILDGSDFTTVIPAEEVGAAERTGIVEFVDLNPELTAILRGVQDSVQTTGFIGADVEAEITVTDKTPITIVLDPTTGDNLVVRGNASPLFVGMRPSGEINMSGRYELTEGKYSMDFYDLVSRELDITEGSYINWTGDPLLAEMQVTAIYRVEAAPMELVASRAGGTPDPALRNQLPFEVYVYVEGQMLTPEIRFDIQLPEEQQARAGSLVVSSLGNLRQDESELNKQVFALLVLNRFLAPDPLSSSGGSFAATARNSLSQVMSDQLNQLTNRYAGGLGLELGVNSYEDYSSGTGQGRTDLNVALRQQFLNDRLTVRLGTDIGLEGQNQGQAQNNMSGFGGDLSVEYSLTEDGRLRVRGFQRNQYEGVLDGGDVRVTGASLIYVRDYNNFSDLFRSLERRRIREAERNLERAKRVREEEKKLRKEGIE